VAPRSGLRLPAFRVFQIWQMAEADQRDAAPRAHEARDPVNQSAKDQGALARRCFLVRESTPCNAAGPDGHAEIPGLEEYPAELDSKTVASSRTPECRPAWTVKKQWLGAEKRLPAPGEPMMTYRWRRNTFPADP